jgi:hypothetical protein
MDEKEWLALLDNRYRSIGKFVYGFSTLEICIGHHLQTTIRLEDSFSRIVLSNYDFASLCRVMGAALKVRAATDKQKEDVDKIVGRFLKINEARVRIVHGSWLLHIGAFHTSRNSLQSKLHFRDADELERLVVEIDSVMDDLVKLAGEIDPQPPAH